MQRVFNLPKIGFVRALAILLPFFVAGCSKTPEPLHPVHGVVTVNGKELKGGTVQFEMLEKGTTSGKIYTAAGVIDSEGNYQLSTFGEMGAPAGEHRVWVSPNFAGITDKIGVGIEKTTPFPKKYMVPTTTDLKFTVAADDNTINIDVPSH